MELALTIPEKEGEDDYTLEVSYFDSYSEDNGHVCLSIKDEYGDYLSEIIVSIAELRRVVDTVDTVIGFPMNEFDSYFDNEPEPCKTFGDFEEPQPGEPGYFTAELDAPKSSAPTVTIDGEEKCEWLGCPICYPDNNNDAWPF